jgi:transposase InsO family protein
MCVINSLTKHTYFILTHTTINAEGTALLFLKEVWKHHGTPRVVVSDRGPQFIATFTHKLYKLLGIKLAMSMAYHPQTDRQMERVNQVLEGYLQVDDRMTGTTSYPQASSSTTRRYTH